VGKRHGLEQINVLDIFGNLTDGVPEAYRGMERFLARQRVVADMHAAGLLAKIEPTTHTVPHGDRSNVVIEPYLTDQWYVNAEEMAKPAIAAVETGKTQFVPKAWDKTYFEWMRNIQPWCISRQLWWGHQIPAWYGPDGHVFVAHDEAEAQALAQKHYATSPSPRARGEGRGEGQVPGEASDGAGARGVAPQASAQASAPHPNPLPVRTGRGDVELTRDEDVLDTWFSSALWAFSTLGWPDHTPEVERRYPTNVLVTGFDIIFFWVARMMMMGLHFMKEVPFRDVYIHALVRDEKGQKMSKAKGNVVDPLVLIDQYGADALRFTLAAMAAQGRDIKLATQRVEGYRNFATKLWNASRFAEMNECVRQRDFDPTKVKATLNRWIVGETERAVTAITAGIEAYKFNEAAGAAYEFVWGDFCDWYLELIKPILAGDDEPAKAETRACVAWVLDQILKLLHPFMPFITEELWAHMVEHGVKRETILALSQWPAPKGLQNPAADEEIGWVQRVISEVRSVRTEMNVPAGAKIPLLMMGASKAVKERMQAHDETIMRLARLDEIKFAKEAPKGSALIVIGDVTLALPLEGVIDMEAERKRLAKEIEKTQSDKTKCEAWLGNEANVARSPEHVVELNRERVAEASARIAKLEAALKRIEV
jgi:valyl-tRNA synthetase